MINEPYWIQDLTDKSKEFGFTCMSVNYHVINKIIKQRQNRWP
jgi:hypothetical protein